MKKDHMHTYTLVLTIRNQPGVLVRCAQVFNRRGHNIETLNVEALPGEDNASQMTITAYGLPATIKQIRLQLAKLVDVIDVTQEGV